MTDPKAMHAAQTELTAKVEEIEKRAAEAEKRAFAAEKKLESVCDDLKKVRGQICKIHAELALIDEGYENFARTEVIAAAIATQAREAVSKRGSRDDENGDIDVVSHITNKEWKQAGLSPPVFLPLRIGARGQVFRGMDDADPKKLAIASILINTAEHGEIKIDEDSTSTCWTRST